MRIAYVDPGLSSRKGHNAAMLEEFDTALAIERGHAVSYLCAASADPKIFDGLAGSLKPTFRVDGYARLRAADLFDEQRLQMIDELTAADLQASSVLDTCDAILMPTAYPLHLRALARRRSVLAGRRVALGLLLPARFWGGDDDACEQRIGEIFADSIDSLNAGTDLFAYSETGSFSFGANAVSLATLLPPLAAPNALHVQRLAAEHRPPNPDGPLLGFFGSPFSSKGFGLLVEALQGLARNGVQPAARIMLRLPAGYEQVCAQLNALGPWVDATSRQADNRQYLQEMAGADVVLGYYDPREYGAKMSGIVPEAISLGKPLLLAEGCNAICDFLERHAPGSFVSGPYDAQILADVLMLPGSAWDRPARCARLHAPLMQQLKSMDRYLSVCGLG